MDIVFVIPAESAELQAAISLSLLGNLLN